MREEVTKIGHNVKPIKYVFVFVKFMFSKKATKIDEIFTINLTLCPDIASG